MAENNFNMIDADIAKSLYIEKLWLGGNPFHCNCDMTWMIEWLKNFTSPSGQHIIIDYKDVKCVYGKMIGKPIYKLNPEDMGCVPKKAKSQKLLWIGTGVGTAVLFLFASAIVVKKCYDRNINENLDKIEYDAFFSYRSEISIYLLI